MPRIVVIAALGARLLLADVRQCACDATKPETMRSRECSLCNEADKQTGEIFFLKDTNPRKPNRWLALPRAHGAAGHPLSALPPALQARLWTEAMAKAKELWGPEEWGIAYNSEANRTQCHGHVHIGKLLKGLAPGKYIDVAGPGAIRLPKDGLGVWIHPVAGGKLRVHYGEGITETVLLR
jgi:diadenosine tetraphosphate (Ap4A) HIT family hydrolase